MSKDKQLYQAKKYYVIKGIYKGYGVIEDKEYRHFFHVDSTKLDTIVKHVNSYHGMRFEICNSVTDRITTKNTVTVLKLYVIEVGTDSYDDSVMFKRFLKMIG